MVPKSGKCFVNTDKISACVGVTSNFPRLVKMVLLFRFTEIGGAHGKGLVIVDEKVDGRTSLSQVSIGLQLGGQKYSEFIFFKDQTALDHFRRGNFELGAQASAVAVTLGASADADYDKRVGVFTQVGGGLMYEASIAGQKFKYEPEN